MLRRIMDYGLSFFEKGKPLARYRPLFSALDSFLYEAPIVTTKAPHIRDAVDLKRWMLLVVLALVPCTLMAIWNTGVQKMVYSAGNLELMKTYLAASHSFGGYFDFCFSEGRWITILKDGLLAFLPIVLISYGVGGLWEVFFAIIRRHEVAEGFLVTGILYALILPATIPYWMAAVGISFGVVVGKELFGGTGMNILNPALTARIFLFFTFPAQMTGAIWAGTNPTTVARSLKKINAAADVPSWDGFTQASALARFNVADDIKRVHVDAIAANAGQSVSTMPVIERQLEQWNPEAVMGQMNGEQLHNFVTQGLHLPPDSYDAAYEMSGLQYGMGHDTDWNLFFGNRLGSMGETSILFAILGALILMWVGVGSWRTMVAVGLGAYITALIFEFCARTFGVDGGAWNIARYAFPAYKHLLMGSLIFGLVFMATEPVSSPYMSWGKWVYGFLIGFVVLFIRVVNPAYPEGVMLAILFANVFSPLIDYYAIRSYRRPHRV